MTINELNKIFIVAKWEFLEKVKTKAFILSLIISPLIVMLFAFGPTLLLSHQEEGGTKPIGILDASGKYFLPAYKKISAFTLKNNQPAYIVRNLYNKASSINALKKTADSLTLKNDIDGYIFITSSNDAFKFEYRSPGSSAFKDLSRFERTLNQVRIESEFRKRNADTSLIRITSANVTMNPVKIDKSGKEAKNDFLVTFFSSFMFIMVLMMTILSSGGMLIRSLLEEKSNRLIEILVSSCTAKELLGGKVLGLCLLGLLQVLVWAIISLGLLGNNIIPPEAFNNILPMLVYFVLGFFFYSALFVGVGSVVSTEQEAQMVNSYLSILLIVPVVFIAPVIENPDTVLVKVLSYIPFTTPTIMLIRLNASHVPVSEIFLTFLILIISTAAAVVFSSKIFEIGILSYGKMSNLKEIVKLIKRR